jgi:hypothetical protein
MGTATRAPTTPHIQPQKMIPTKITSGFKVSRRGEAPRGETRSRRQRGFLRWRSAGGRRLPLQRGRGREDAALRVRSSSASAAE